MRSKPRLLSVRILKISVTYKIAFHLEKIHCVLTELLHEINSVLHEMQIFAIPRLELLYVGPLSVYSSLSLHCHCFGWTLQQLLELCELGCHKPWSSSRSVWMKVGSSETGHWRNWFLWFSFTRVLSLPLRLASATSQHWSNVLLCLGLFFFFSMEILHRWIEILSLAAGEKLRILNFWKPFKGGGAHVPGESVNLKHDPRFLF